MTYFVSVGRKTLTQSIYNQHHLVMSACSGDQNLMALASSLTASSKFGWRAFSYSIQSNLPLLITSVRTCSLVKLCLETSLCSCIHQPFPLSLTGWKFNLLILLVALCHVDRWCHQVPFCPSTIKDGRRHGVWITCTVYVVGDLNSTFVYMFCTVVVCAVSVSVVRFAKQCSSFSYLIYFQKWVD